MKTLNEVIKAFEYTYENDPTAWTYGVDALFYLKEYRFIVENCAETLAEKFPSENIPLTWDELSQMEGKPVWVEDNIDEPEDLTKYWAIYKRIEKDQETEYALLSDFYYDKAQYGESWQAYRKEHHDDN